MISIVLLAYQMETFLDETISSLTAQSVGYELVAVDNGSTDGTTEVLREAGARIENFRFLRLPGVPVARARNCGVDAATGEFIALLDGDDLWDKDKLKRQARYLESEPSSLGVVCHMRRFLSKGCSLPPGYSEEMFETPVPAFIPSALMVRREAFEEIGPYDETLGVGSDSEWMVRMMEAQQPHLLPDTLLSKRVHQNNFSAQVEAYRKEMLTALRRSLVRRGHLSRES
ncbi:MAG: glycosyltransferase family 2 protein [Candidatus Eremiobacteraeota bacterium]|nr:glycosyltransferase family 2 protein [Candidatus Eremiobacteraeota bacterium]